jgi:SDR family mycofactocin-dependent oxidoreductase
MSDAATRFANKVVFITGVARGQGRSHAVRLAAEGASIIGVDCVAPVATVQYDAATPDDLDETVEAVQRAGGRIVAEVGDVRDGPALRDLVQRGVAELGPLDGVVANAAICTYGRLWELSDEQWQTMIDVNLTGVWQTLRATVPVLLDQDRGGSIVVVSSAAGLTALPLLSHYGATKAGITNMAQSLAHELAPHSIRVNTLHPTAVRTPMGKDPSLRDAIAAHPDVTQAFGNLLPVGSIDAEDVSNAVLWLLSDEARYLTGVALPVDAGASRR